MFVIDPAGNVVYNGAIDDAATRVTDAKLAQLRARRADRTMASRRSGCVDISVRLQH
jgi:hypothetical protein